MAYRCTYNEVVNNKNFNRIVTKTKVFNNFIEAVKFSRYTANNTVITSKPLIEEIER
jgi:hypothetical protein